MGNRYLKEEGTARLCTIVCKEGDVKLVVTSGDLFEKIEKLNKIVSFYSDRITRDVLPRFSRMEQLKLLFSEHPQKNILMVFPTFTRHQIIKVVAQKKLIPAGISRHLFNRRCLNVRVPLSLFDEKDDILPLFFVVDVVLSDSSSAALEAVLVDKPLVVLDMEKDERNLTERDEYNGLWYSSGQVYSKSIEQQIKKPEMAVGEVVKNPEDIESAIEKSFAPKAGFAENRKKSRDELFSFNDGKCGERAAEVIKKYLNDEIKPEPPLFGAAIRAYSSSQARHYQKRWRKKEEEVEKLKESIRILQAEKRQIL